MNKLFTKRFLLAALAAGLLFLIGGQYLLHRDDYGPYVPEDGEIVDPTPYLITDAEFLAATIAELRLQESLDLLDEIPVNHRYRESFLASLLRIKESEGRDNAMIHYMKADWLRPLTSDKNWPPLWDQEGPIKRILEEGRYEQSDLLTSYTTIWQPAFEEIRKGAALDYAKNIGSTMGFSTPVPNFLSAQRAATILCVEGLFFESGGRTDEALDNYLTVLTLGRDYGTEGATLISHLVGIAIDGIALKRLHQISRSKALGDPALTRALERMGEIERNQTPIMEGLRLQESIMRNYLIAYYTNPKPFEKKNRQRDTLWSLISSGRFTWKRYQSAQKRRAEDRAWKANPQKAIKDYKTSWAKRLKIMETDWWDPARKPMEEELAMLMENVHIIVKQSVPNYTETQVRYLVMRSKLRETRLTAALEIWKRGQGRYPESLAPLKGQFFAPALPIDPFSGKSFLYKTSPEGKSYDLWGIGPDNVDGGGAIFYDPTNGTKSAGDVRY